MNSYRWIGLDAEEETITLKRFHGVDSTELSSISDISEDERARLKICAGIDVETTGLQHQVCEVIEIGLRLYYFEPSTGKIVAFGESYSGLQEVAEPLSPEIVKLTGITNEMLKGQTIDWQKVDSLLGEANLVIAHNASFDRPFVEKYSSVAKDKPWACSLEQVDWASWGFPVRKLEVLTTYHGFFSRAHRALVDVEVLMHLLSFTSPDEDEKYYFTHLLECARRPLMRVIAANSPFESKDLLKDRGYYWEPKERYWHRKIFREDWDSELEWIEEKVYSGEFRGYTREIPLTENFRADM